MKNNSWKGLEGRNTKTWMNVVLSSSGMENGCFSPRSEMTTLLSPMEAGLQRMWGQLQLCTFRSCLFYVKFCFVLLRQILLEPLIFLH